jgi:uncharacterized protein YuzE
VKILENVYITLSESRTMCGIEIWGLQEGWKETGKIESRFRKAILGVPRYAANNMAE